MNTGLQGDILHSILVPFLFFLAGYVINMFYISVLYHRGLAHSSVRLSAWTKRWALRTGRWVTGIEPTAWVCMHRLHHMHSDTSSDPHSPSFLGLWGLFSGQHRSYRKILEGLGARNADYLALISDLPAGPGKFRAWLPYFLQTVFALSLGFLVHNPLCGVAFYLGLMSHPIQGWMVNGIAHRFGYRNFATSDDSKNNTLVALLVMGEGYQNNHHANPERAKFSRRWFELDLGYAICLLAEKFGILSTEYQSRQNNPSLN